MKRVTIGIPIFNTGQYIEECLDSIVSQSYRNLEILCVINGSTDNSEQIIKRYQQKDNRIIIEYSDVGVSKARNRILAKASGEYLLFVDSDDIISYDS